MPIRLENKQETELIHKIRKITETIIKLEKEEINTSHLYIELETLLNEYRNARI